jgi:serine/threonine protein kinase
MVPKAEELVGRTIGGYLLLKMLGKSSISAVFLARSVDASQEQAAIKVLTPSEISTAEEEASFQARFLRVAEAAQKMHQEHILPVWDFGVADHIFYMVMPLLTGATLAEKLANEQESMPLEEVARYLNQLASAIDYAHQHGVIHRDIKPSNVLIDEQGNAFLVDFGILHLFDSGPYATDEESTSLTGNGKIYGTPAYMAPERFKRVQVKPVTDIYSLGVMLYQLVTGKLPFTVDTPTLVGMKHLNEMPPPPRSLRPDLPEPAEAVILKALAKQPTDRFKSASALATAFDASIKGQWVRGLQPVPSMAPPKAGDTQVEQPAVADVVPVPEGPAQSNPLVLGPALASSVADMAVADHPTQANPTPAVSPQGRWRDFPIWLLWGAVVIAAVVLLVRLLQASASSTQNTPPASAPPASGPGGGGGGAGSAPGGVATPTVQSGGGVSFPPVGATPTPALLPTPTPMTTPPAAVPGASPTPMPGNIPPPTPPGVTPMPTVPPPANPPTPPAPPPANPLAPTPTP